MPSEPILHVATLIAAGTNVTIAGHIATLRSLLPGARDASWLEPDVALDIHFFLAPDELGALRQRVSSARKGEEIDIVLQPAEGRRKRLLLADMDSTMIGQECIDELADFVGLKPMVSAITERAMRGEIAFEPALRERVALLKGLPVGAVDEVLKKRITLTPGGRALVRTMQAHGGYCALVSGGFTLFTGAVAQRLGFDEHRGNTLIVERDHFAGTVTDPIVGREAKLAALLEIRGRLQIAPEDTMAVGDGANDLAMIEAAGLGVAYHAKPAVAAAAAGRIDYGDLRSLLFVQGYRADEFTKA